MIKILWWGLTGLDTFFCFKPFGGFLGGADLGTGRVGLGWKHEEAFVLEFELDLDLEVYLELDVELEVDLEFEVGLRKRKQPVPPVRFRSVNGLLCLGIVGSVVFLLTLHGLFMAALTLSCCA